MGVSLAVAAVVLVPAAALDLPARTPPLNAVAAVAGLGILCTAAALVLYGAPVVEVGAGRSLVVTYLNPLVAVAFGALLLGERPGGGAIAGLVLILGGAWLSTDGRLPARAARLPRAQVARDIVDELALGRGGRLVQPERVGIRHEVAGGEAVEVQPAGRTPWVFGVVDEAVLAAAVQGGVNRAHIRELPNRQRLAERLLGSAHWKSSERSIPSRSRISGQHRAGGPLMAGLIQGAPTA
jgi:EamA-like transporter family